MNNPHSLDIGSVWYGPLTHISWLSDFFFFSAYSQDSVLLKFDMKMFVTVARLEKGQMFTQDARPGHPCTLEVI